MYAVIQVPTTYLNDSNGEKLLRLVECFMKTFGQLRLDVDQLLTINTTLQNSSFSLLGKSLSFFDTNPGKHFSLFEFFFTEIGNPLSAIVYKYEEDQATSFDVPNPFDQCR